MRDVIAAFLAMFSLSSASSIDHEQLRTDAAAAFAYASLLSETPVVPKPSGDSTPAGQVDPPKASATKTTPPAKSAPAKAEPLKPGHQWVKRRVCYTDGTCGEVWVQAPIQQQTQQGYGRRWWWR